MLCCGNHSVNRWHHCRGHDPTRLDGRAAQSKGLALSYSSHSHSDRHRDARRGWPLTLNRAGQAARASLNFIMTEWMVFERMSNRFVSWTKHWCVCVWFNLFFYLASGAKTNLVFVNDTVVATVGENWCWFLRMNHWTSWMKNGHECECVVSVLQLLVHWWNGNQMKDWCDFGLEASLACRTMQTEICLRHLYMITHRPTYNKPHTQQTCCRCVWIKLLTKLLNISLML